MNNAETLINYIETLLKENNFTKAAEKLYISQPYLTQLIKRIEEKLGTKILNREKAPFTLTESGQVYYQYLENIAAENNSLNQQLQRFRDKNNETIRIAILESLGTFLLPKILPSYLERHPTVKIQINEGFPHQSEERLLADQVDCYMGQTPETVTQGINTYINGGEVYYIVIPSNSKYFIPNKFILDKDTYKLENLLQEPFVLSSAESAIRHQVNVLFQIHKLVPKVKMETNSVITATNLAVNGLGLTVSSASILKRIRQLPINLYPLDPALIRIRYFIGVKKEAHITKALQDLIDNFQSQNLQERIN